MVTHTSNNFALENEEHPNNTPEKAQKYNEADIQNTTYYLGYRDIPELLQKYNIGKKAIDYGCGTGRSSRFLKQLGFDTIGVDFSQEMLKLTSNSGESGHYLHIKSGQIPVLDNSYDLVFSCYVFLTVPTREELRTIFKEAYRCLQEGGFFVFVTGSEKMYSHEWLSYNVDFPENKNLESGSCTRIVLKELDIEYLNYFWTSTDYETLASESNFHILEKHCPLGTPNDPQQWVSEIKHSPYSIFILQK